MALLVAAFGVASLRDLGSGLIAERPGPAGAPASRSNPLGLALRLQRGPIVGWAIRLFLTGIVYGSLGNDIGQMILDNPAFEDIFIRLEGPP
ncbi:MAG TPA: hypothetical protein VIR58_03435 [Acidimicrobiales bacterium]